MLKTYEATFGDIKPTGPGYNPDSDYPADAQDEFRYRLAIQHALLGQSSEAITYLLKIIETPAAPDSRWIEPAQEFLELYQTPQDIYKVCLHAKTECRIHQALEQAVRSFTIADYPVLLQRLEEHGVPILAKAFINIDLDSSLDQWFITRNPIDGQFELWLISSSAYAPKAIFISNVPSLHPEFKLYTLEWWSNRYNLISHENLFSIFSVNTQNLFAFVRRKLDLEPYVVPYEVNEDSKHLASYPLLWQTINDLLSGADPKWVIERLNIIAEEESYYADRELNYFLGLAYELSGDEDNAVKAYLTVWRSCCFHYWDGPVVDPFAIMAQAKLRKIP
jgi:hypothetical protein